MSTTLKRASVDQSSRAALIMTSAALSGRPTPYFRVENTYKVAPDKVFSSDEVRRVIQKVLEAELKDKEYEPSQCTLLSSQLADLIKNEVKDLGYVRYKIVSVVSVGHSHDSTISITSRCVWDDKFDNYSEYVYNGDAMYAIGLVYGIYCE